VPVWIRRAITPILLIVVWEMSVRLGWVTDQVLAPPSALPATVSGLWESGDLQEGILVSATRAGVGLFFGTVVAVLVAAIAGLWRWGEDAAEPLVQMLRPIPATAILPLVVLLMGIYETPKIFLVAYGVFFPVYLNTVQGIRSVDVKVVESASVHGLNRWQLVRQVVLPSAMPSFFTGFRFSVGLSWIVLVVAEQLNAQSGIGYLMVDAQRYFRPDVIIVGLIVYALFGLISDAIVRLVERRVLRWRQEFTGA
jgi:sulfonate transport system permease protein